MENLNEAAMTILEGIILMTDFSILISRTESWIMPAST
jgi:long-chain acyl-CoA synthetase